MPQNHRYFLIGKNKVNYMANSSNKDAYDEVFASLEKHNKWFENSIPLIASENVPSPAVREAIISDFGNRYAEGWPGERVMLAVPTLMRLRSDVWILQKNCSNLSLQT